MSVNRLIVALFYGVVALGLLLMAMLSFVVLWVLVFGPKD